MTNFLGGPRQKSRTPTPATALRVQSSVAGAPRPFGYGRSRLSGNLLWYGAFEAYAVHSSGGGGGKNVTGGGGKGSTATGYIYNASFIIGLAEGPIADVRQAWANKTPILPSQVGFSVFDGDYQQEPWPYLASEFPGQAQSFRGIAYMAQANCNLGSTPELDNYSFEVDFAIGGAVTESYTIASASAYKFTAQYFSFDADGVVEYWTVPYSAPYQLQVATPDGQNDPIAYQMDYTSWPGQAAQGVLYDANATVNPGQPMTRLTEPSPLPSQGEYYVTGYGGPYSTGGLYTFAAADAGQPVDIIDCAISPGVYYGATVTGTTTMGSTLVTSLGSLAGVAQGARVSGGGVAPGSFVTEITGGSATGSTTSGSLSLGSVSGRFTAASGTPIADAKGAIPAGATVASATAPSFTLATASAVTATADSFLVAVNVAGTFDASTLNQIDLASTAGIIVGMEVTSYWIADVAPYYSPPAGPFTVQSLTGTTVVIADPYGSELSGLQGAGDSFSFTAQVTGDVTSGSAVVANPSSLAPLSTSATVTDQLGAFPAGTAVNAVTQGAITLTAGYAATASETGDIFTFASEIVLSTPAVQGATSALTFRGAALTQVLSDPGAGQFMLSVQPGAFGEYTFSAYDAGKTVVIVDLPDANPADVLYDFLTNPYYGMTQFEPARIGDLSAYRDYCLAANLLVSPLISTQSAANAFVKDLMSATNSEVVWSGGQLTVVPYGDSQVSGNGATWTAPSEPIYALDDDDFLANEGTNSHSVSSAGSPDPVTITRQCDTTQIINDIQIEYLDRANDYNPTIAEVQDDAAIELFGLKSNGSKQLHLLCNRQCAMNAAQLQLGRVQVRRTFCFTLDRKYILLDPMDIVSLTDTNAGLVEQWVRIKEITENDDRTLSIVAEEYLQGTGAAPEYGHQAPAGYVPNYNLAPGNALAPIMLDVPTQLVQTLGMETWIATNGAWPWGGCDVWISSDNVSFRYAGTMQGGTAMGVTTATFASGSDPDTVNTLAVNLAESQGSLLPGTDADANELNTLSYVCNTDGTNGEYVSYSAATLTAQYKYSLGTYLRRGQCGSAIAAHAAGSLFTRLREASLFAIPYIAGQIGKTIYVKLLSFNLWGGGRQSLGEVSSYSHTIGGPPAATATPLATFTNSTVTATTTDLADEAATNQTAASVAGPVTISSSAWTAIASVTLTTIGGAVQIAANFAISNSDASASAEVLFEIWRNGVPIVGGGYYLTAGLSTTMIRQYTDAPGAGSWTYTLNVEYGGSPPAGDVTASTIDLQATEIRR